MELIDSHCHLNYDYAPKTDTDLVNEAHAAGIVAMMTIGTDMQSLPAVVAISEKHAKVFHSVGVHPHDALTFDDADLEKLRKASAHPKCRAIGEIGLDYYYDNSPRDQQIIRFRQQLELAAEVKQPVVIHSRDAEEDLLREITEYTRKLKGTPIPGVIHCFTGTEKFGLACLDLGFYISFSGIFTFKTAENLREAARKFPLERLLVETDSPFLAPIPFRGRKCEPAMVKYTALKLAEVKGVPADELAAVTTANARRVFRI